MNILNFIFLLVRSNVPITEKQLNDIQVDANEWRLSLGKNESQDMPKGMKPKEWYLWLDDQWYVKLALCILYIPINKALKRSNVEEYDESEYYEE